MRRVGSTGPPAACGPGPLVHLGRQGRALDSFALQGRILIGRRWLATFGRSLPGERRRGETATALDRAFGLGALRLRWFG